MTVLPMIAAHGIRKTYGSTAVLDDLDLEVTEGTVLALLGPNGAGKTTLVRILSTLVKPDAGTAAVAGHDVVSSPLEVRRAISLTGQYAAVDELLTGEENLILMGRLHRLSRRNARSRASDLLTAFDLSAAARRPVKTYSGGMRRRLDIAVSLITRAPVIFLDEPTTGLDPRSRQAMWEVIRTLVRDGATVLLTTQYLDEADELAHTIAVIDGGRIIAHGSPDELKRRVAVEEAELTFDTVDRRRAAETLLGGAASAADSDPCTLRVPTDGQPAQVRNLLDALHAGAIPIARLALRQPTLDEVFLDLTSRAPASASTGKAAVR